MVNADLSPTKQADGNARKAKSWLYRTVGSRFGYLLLALICLLLSSPLLTRGFPWNLLLGFFASSVLVAGLYAAKPGRRSLTIGLTLALTDLAITQLADVESSQFMMTLQAALWLSTLVYVSTTILTTVFDQDGVDVETLRAALCVYLLLGLIWLYLYGLIDMFAPNSFRLEGKPLSLWSTSESRPARFFYLLLFSYSRLTAAAYDDVSAATGFTNMCTCLEALSGQVYLAVVIARLVGVQSTVPPKE